MNPVQEIIDEQHEEIESALDVYQKKTSKIVRKAEIALLVWLATALVVRYGRIAQTSENLKTLQAIPDRFNRLLREMGYNLATGAFLATLDQQQAVFQHMVSALGIGKPRFSAVDEAYFAARRRAAALDLLNAASFISLRARQRALLSAGGTVSDLQDVLVAVYDRTAAAVRAAAATAVTTFYRAIADRGYEILQAENPGLVIEFTYAGPLDEKNRKFCWRLMVLARAGQTWTRAEIDAMDNGQLPNVFETCGGYDCRHQFVGVLKGPQNARKQ